MVEGDETVYILSRAVCRAYSTTISAVFNRAATYPFNLLKFDFHPTWFCERFAAPAQISTESRFQVELCKIPSV